MQWTNGELVIELAGKRNQNFAFPLMSMTVRGRFDVRLIRQESTNTDMGNLPVIPGQHIALDRKGRKLRVIDPLGWTENKSLLDEANRIISPWFGRMGPHPTSTLVSLEPWEAKTALWWMAQKVWDGEAEVHAGDFPDNSVAGRKKILVDTEGDLKVRFFAPLTLPDGTPESPFASEEEIKRLIAGPTGDRFILEPVGT